MSAQPSGKRRRRWWLWLRLGAAAVLLAWVGRYAYLRLTVMPSLAPDEFYAHLARPWTPEPGDVTDELTDALMALSKPIPLVLPDSPAGMQWEMEWKFSGGRAGQGPADPADALNGPWTPGNRPNLQSVISYLELAETRELIAKLHSLRGRPWHFDPWMWLAGKRGLGVAELRSTTKTLAADARYQHAQRGNMVAAWEDIKTTLWLIETPSCNTLFESLVRWDCESICCSELRQMACECTIDSALAAEVEAALVSIAPAKELWPRAIADDRRVFLAAIDACFTRDEHGNGWFVPGSRAALQAELFGGPYSTWLQSARLWSLASVLYNDRRTVETRATRYMEYVLAANTLPYAKAVAALDRLDTTACPFTIADGCPLGVSSTSGYGGSYAMFTRRDAQRQATRLNIALGQYRARHGRYPTALAELVPNFIDALPPDPFGASSFGYRLEAPDRYVLWSLGIDGEDDGGQPGLGYAGQLVAFSDDGDDIYTFPRGVPTAEPELVPAEEDDAP